MFKAPFSFDGRIRRIEYFLSGIIGGIVSSIAWALGVGTVSYTHLFVCEMKKM